MLKSLFSPWLALAVLGLSDLLMVADILPRAASFALAAIAVAFVALALRNDAMLFTIASFPLSPALPIPGFDAFALWRLTVAAFALRIAVDYRNELAPPETLARLRKALLPHEWIGLAFLALGALSLAVAQDPIAGLRKFVFLVTIAALYATLRIALPRDPRVSRAALLGLLVAFGTLLLIGFAQYILVELISLYDFWQLWALDVIPVFYGNDLGQTLSASNTWFSYYAGSPPTLRMFSLLPDSHSFGVLMLLGFLFTVALRLTPATLPIGSAWLFALSLAFALAVFLNGSRGIWLTALSTFVVSFFFLVEGQDRDVPSLARAAKRTTAGMLILFLLFPIASFLSSRAHGAGIEDAALEETVAFSRARSIFDTDETSNRGRLDIWKAGLESVREHPVLGVGFGNTAVALREDVSEARRGASAHNLYLDAAVETGALGGLLVLGFFLALTLTAARALIRNVAPATFALPFTLSVAWIAAYNLFDVVLFNDRVLLAFLAFLALAVETVKSDESFPSGKCTFSKRC